MASIYQLKSKFQNILRPFVSVLAKLGITANHITILACVFSVAIGFFFLAKPATRDDFYIIPIFLFVRMALNAIDGMLAREHNMKSSLGAILNELGDVVADSALYYPMGLIWGVHIHLVVAFVVLAILTEMTGVIAIQIGTVRHYDGPFGKSDRAFTFGLLALLYAMGSNLGALLPWIFSLMIFLEILTIINRAKNALKEVK